MGNYQFKMDNPPQRGQICVIVDSPFTTQEKYPKSAFGQGTKVKVIGSKNLLCSRPNAPQISASLVQFPSGQQDVYLSNNLRPV